MAMGTCSAFFYCIHFSLMISHIPAVICPQPQYIPSQNATTATHDNPFIINKPHSSIQNIMTDTQTELHWQSLVKPAKSFKRKLLQKIDKAFPGRHAHRTNSTISMVRRKRSMALDMVRVKLQAFIFEVQLKRPESNADAMSQLQKFMNAYPHLMLDPEYAEKIITGYNPLVIQEMVCEEFESIRPSKSVANSFFIVNDVGTFTPRHLHDRLHRLLFQITAALGIPSITWLPNRVGQFELDESQLAVRLEPLTWHVSHALVDFIHAFNWNIVIIVTNKLVSGSATLLEEMRNRQSERSAPDHPKYFEFEISHQFEFTGLNATGFTKCIRKNERVLRSCLSPMLNILQEIWKADARVVIFNGDFYDLNALLYIADCVTNSTSHYRHLNELFGERYIWIFTPSTMSSLTVADSQGKHSMDNKVLKESTLFRRIPGMFGLICLNDIERRRSSAELAREIWQNSLIELTSQLTKLYPPEATGQLDSSEPRRMAYFRQILDKLKPEKLCGDSDHLTWQWGRRMFDIMRSLTFTYQQEPVSFLPNGGLNVSTMYVYNSRTSTGQMDWHKVGTWSMSNKWGKQISRLLIDGVTWPGGSNSPPKGRPSKFKVRVVTIKEKPFVIYQAVQEDGKCDGNSLPCKLRPESMFDTDPVIQATERTRFSSVTESPRHATGENVTFDKTSSYEKERGLVNNTLPFNASDYVDGCCSGLTMDLLMELMKDLNFDIDLYEAPDGLWGAWTPEGWNGVIRVLMDNQADMAVTSLKITPNRSQQIDFSVPFLETGIAITVALREGAISPTAFLKPYDYQSWCMILIFSVHASGAALFIFEWLSPNGLNRGQMSTSEHRFTLFRSLWLIWSMLFGAAVNADNPRGVASRFLANIWALFALVFLASYTANLAAFMIAKEDFYDLSGMNDWRLQQPWNVKPPFRFSTIPSGATEENIKINFPEMGAYMRNFNRSTVEEGLASLKSGELDAFIYDANVLDYWASKDEGCKLRIVGNLYAMTGYGIGFAKGSRWLEKVNSRILDYQKNGKLQRWKKFWQTGSCRKDSALGNTNKTLGVKNFISAFILLLCGILLCSLILGFEHIVYRTIGSHVRRKIWKNCCSVKPMDIIQAVQDRQMDAYQSNSTRPHVKHQHCSDPACVEQTVKLQNEADNLRKHIKRLESLLEDRGAHKESFRAQFAPPQGNAVITFPMSRIEVKTTGTGDKNLNDRHDDRDVKRRKYTIIGPNMTSVSGRLDQSTRSKNATGTNSKLWDIYSKVAVIPIEPSVPVNYSCGSTAIEDNEACTIILPRLSSSPNRRRRIAKPDILAGPKTITDALLGEGQQDDRTIHQTDHRYSSKSHLASETTSTGLSPGSDHGTAKINLEMKRLGLPSTHSISSKQSAERIAGEKLPEINGCERLQSTMSRHRKPTKHRELRFLRTPSEYVDPSGSHRRESEARDNMRLNEHQSDSAFEKESVL